MSVSENAVHSGVLASAVVFSTAAGVLQIEGWFGQGQVPSGVVVKRFWRPEDISADKAYAADWWEVYASDEEKSISLDDVLSKCSVVGAGPASGPPIILEPCIDRMSSRWL